MKMAIARIMSKLNKFYHSANIRCLSRKFEAQFLYFGVNLAINTDRHPDWIEVTLINDVIIQTFA